MSAGNLTSSTRSSYCTKGYIGHLCSECGSNFFSSWSGKGCEECAQGQSHAPTIGLGVLLILLVSVLVWVCYLKRKRLLTDDQIKRSEDLKWIAAVKITILLFTAQVVSQFSVISSGTGERSGRLPASPDCRGDPACRGDPVCFGDFRDPPFRRTFSSGVPWGGSATVLPLPPFWLACIE